MSETGPGCPRCDAHQRHQSSFCPTCGARLAGKPRQLRRSRSQSQILGVCAGLADYLDTDPTLTRVLFLVLTLFSGLFPGVVLYVLMALVVPAE